MEHDEMDKLEKEALETLSKLQQPSTYSAQMQDTMHRAAATTLDHIRTWRMPY